MKILVTGATGFVGSSLLQFLLSQGHDVRCMVRRSSTPGSDDIEWNPMKRSVNTNVLEGFDAVVHLAGENIAGGRWTGGRKRRIRDSRVIGTLFLAGTLAERRKKPQVLVSASAVGYYGDRGPKLLDEESPAGWGFLPDVCKAWEAATNPAAQAGIRVVNLRIGMVLGAGGGALQRMLGSFSAGIGGTIGDGSQFWSWIAQDDLNAAILHVIQTETLSGPVNAVSPHPVTNREFTKVLGHILLRPTILPLPGFAARLALGGMAGPLLLASTRVEPAKLIASGFKFQFVNLEQALRHILDSR